MIPSKISFILGYLWKELAVEPIAWRQRQRGLGNIGATDPRASTLKKILNSTKKKRQQNIWMYLAEYTRHTPLHFIGNCCIAP